MPNKLDTGFCGPTYHLNSGNVAIDRSINLYVETVQRGQITVLLADIQEIKLNPKPI